MSDTIQIDPSVVAPGVHSHFTGVVPHDIAKARWIWSNDDPDETNVWVYARKCFEVKNPQDAVLTITADLRYVAWVNGQCIGFGPAKSEMTQPTLDQIPIEDYLAVGENVITILVYSLGNVKDISSVMPRRGALLASIAVDGQLIVTDKQWKVQRERAYQLHALRRGEMQPHNEVFDDRLSLHGLHDSPALAYDDSHWANATELSDGPMMEPYTGFETRDIPLIPWQFYPPDRMVEWGHVRFQSAVDHESIADMAEQIAGASRHPDQENRMAWNPHKHTATAYARGLPETDGVYVRWDFSTIWTGYPVIEISGDPGTVVDLSYGEHLPAGRIDPRKHGMEYFDRIILGEQVCRHRIMWPKCFRYMQADIRGGKATIHRIGLERSTYPVQHHGSFHSSDASLDQAWRIGTHTLQICMEDSFMDTPWRERGSWLGDTILNIMGNYYAFGDTALARRLLRLHVFGQLPDGSMSCKYPGCKSSYLHTWSLTYPVILFDYFKYTGDAEFVRDMWPTCDRIIDWLESYRDEQALYSGFPLKVTAHDNIYMPIDWSPVDTSGTNAAFQAYAYGFFNVCKKLAKIAGHTEREEFCSERANTIRERFQQTFWEDERGVFVNGWKNGSRMRRWGCQENYLALALDMATPEQRQSIIERLVQEDLMATFVPKDGEYDDPLATMSIALNRYRWDDEKMVPLGTPFMGWWAMVALFEAGMGSEALNLMRLHWGNYSKQGATTTWENWDMQASLSHAWGVGPTVVLGRYVLGVTWSETGENYFQVLPQRVDLTQAKGRVPLREGVVEVSWQWHDRDGWEMCVVVPKGYRAMIGLPGDDAEILVINGEQVASPITMSRGKIEFLACEMGDGIHRVSSK